MKRDITLIQEFLDLWTCVIKLIGFLSFIILSSGPKFEFAVVKALPSFRPSTCPHLSAPLFFKYNIYITKRAGVEIPNAPTETSSQFHILDWISASGSIISNGCPTGFRVHCQNKKSYYQDELCKRSKFFGFGWKQNGFFTELLRRFHTSPIGKTETFNIFDPTILLVAENSS